MGCWNATCNVSNLPIFWGDKVVLIPLVKVSSKETKFNPCYPTDNFIPLGFPIFGEYDDYGRLENTHTSAWNESHLRQFKYYFEERDDDVQEKTSLYIESVNSTLIPLPWAESPECIPLPPQRPGEKSP